MQKFVVYWLVAVLCIFPGWAKPNGAKAFDDAYQEFLKELKENPASNRLGALGLNALKLGEMLYEEGSEDLAVLTFNVVRAVSGHSRWFNPLEGRSIELNRLALSRYKKVYGLQSDRLVDPYANLILTLSRRSGSPQRFKETSDRGGKTEIQKLISEIERNVFSQKIEPLKVGGFYKRLAVSNLKERGSYAKRALAIFQEEFGENSVEALRAKLIWFSTLPMKKRVKGYLEVLPLMESVPELKTQRYLIHQVLSAFYFQKKKREEAEYHLQRAGESGEGLFSQQDYIPIMKVAPYYPKRAQTRGIRGFVVVEFAVTEKGSVEAPFVVEASPKGIFDRAAIDAALQFRYVPTYEQGSPVRVEGVRNKMTFDLY